MMNAVLKKAMPSQKIMKKIRWQCEKDVTLSLDEYAGAIGPGVDLGVQRCILLLLCISYYKKLFYVFVAFKRVNTMCYIILNTSAPILYLC